MASLKVIVPLLNKRSLPVTDTADKGNVTGQVKKDFQFESVEQQTNALGDWFKDRDGSWYWGGGLDGITAAKRLLVATSKQSFQWFSDLGIQEIWDQFNERGENVTVAVLDTGYDIANDDLSPAVTGVNVFDGSPPVQMNDTRSPFINDSANSGWHGTFCASMIAARNNKNFYVGIAPKSKLLVGKISSDGGLDTFGLDVIIEGIKWAVTSGAEIIAISFGEFTNEMPDDENYLVNIQQKLNQIIKDKNVLIFASCGDNPPARVLQKERYPASLDGCVSVGATSNGLLSEITVLSNKTIIHAQGVNVESYTQGDTPQKKSGTSMSVPIVAGIAALAVSFLKKKNNGLWDPAALLKKIYDTGIVINNSNKKMIDPKTLFQQL